MRISRLRNDKTIDDIEEGFQAQFQNVEFVEEAEAVVDHDGRVSIGTIMPFFETMMLPSLAQHAHIRQSEGTMRLGCLECSSFFHQRVSRLG